MRFVPGAAYGAVLVVGMAACTLLMFAALVLIAVAGVLEFFGALAQHFGG